MKNENWKKEVEMGREYEVIRPVEKKTWLKRISDVVQKTASIVLYSFLSVILFGIAAGTTWTALKEGGITIGLILGGIYCVLILYWVFTRTTPNRPGRLYGLTRSDNIFTDPCCSAVPGNIYGLDDD